jgi:hypothetical protein
MAIRIWSEEVRAFVEPEDILACGADGVYYSVPQINAVRADGTLAQVWPEDTLLKDYDFRQAEFLKEFAQETNGFGYFYVDSYGLRPKYTQNLSGEKGTAMSMIKESKQEIKLEDFLLKLKFYIGRSTNAMGAVWILAKDSNEKVTMFFQMSDAWAASDNQTASCYMVTKSGTRFSFLYTEDKALYYSGKWELKSLNGNIALKINGNTIATKALTEQVCIKKLEIGFLKYGTYPLSDMYVESLSLKKI